MKLSNKTKKLLIKAIKFKRNLRSIFLNLIVNSKIIIKANKGQPTVRLFSEISLEEKRIVDEFKRLEIKK